MPTATMPSPSASNDKYFGAGHRRPKGPLVWGVRLENRSTRNAEYTITVTAESDPALGGLRYVVEAAYGSIGKGQQFKVYQVEPGRDFIAHKDRAIGFAKQLMNEKKGRSYEFVAQAVSDDGDATSEDQVLDFEDLVTEDTLLDTETEKARIKKIVEDETACDCQGLVEELTWSTWSDAPPADAAVAPLLMQEGYELLKYPVRTPSPRWVVGSFGTCSSGYPHARAVSLSGENAAPKPGMATARYIAEQVLESTAKDARQNGLNFVVVVEESELDVVLVDAMIWGGKDLLGETWLDRRKLIESTFTSTFPQGVKTRSVKLVPRVSSRLREVYLTESEKFRFELYSESGFIGQQGWVLP